MLNTLFGTGALEIKSCQTQENCRVSFFGESKQLVVNECGWNITVSFTVPSFYWVIFSCGPLALLLERWGLVDLCKT